MQATLSDLVNRVEQLSNQVVALSHTSVETDHQGDLAILAKFPVETEDELATFEELLEDETNFKKFVSI